MVAVAWSLLVFFGPPALPRSTSTPETYVITIKVLMSLGSVAALGVLVLWTWRQNRWITIPSVAALVLGQIGVWINM